MLEQPQKFYTAFYRTSKTVYTSRTEAEAAVPKSILVREFDTAADANTYMIFGTYTDKGGILLRDPHIHRANEVYTTSAFKDTEPFISCIVAVKVEKDWDEKKLPIAIITINDKTMTHPMVVEAPFPATHVPQPFDQQVVLMGAAFWGVFTCLECLYGSADDKEPLGGLLSLNNQALIAVGKDRMVKRMYKAQCNFPFEHEVKRYLSHKQGGSGGVYVPVSLLESDRVPLYMMLRDKSQKKDKESQNPKV